MDSGVLLAKTKNVDSAPFIWVVDANPQDIDLVDFVRPDGTEAKVSLGDYRQLADALFHAGTQLGQRVRVDRRAEPTCTSTSSTSGATPRDPALPRRRAVARRRAARTSAA